MSDKVQLAIIGAGIVAGYHHVPGIRIDPRAELAALCDADGELLRRRAQEWNVPKTALEYETIVSDPEIDAVIIATPNSLHRPVALACVEAGKHVMCEKPLGLSFLEARQMYQAARDKDVRHMTAFTYRFAPSMRYMKHLLSQGVLGEPRHFRSQRFVDLPETSWGWRQRKNMAGAGNLYDMTIHRIDFAQDLIGPIHSVCGAVEGFARRDRASDGSACQPSDVDDWSALIGRFQGGAVGVWEGSIVMKGYHNGGLGYEWGEVNGSEMSAVYQLADPNHILLGRHGESLRREAVPEEFLVAVGSPRQAQQGKPSTVFRYDLVYEFVSAIVEGRDAFPGFDAGASAQAVADAVLESSQTGHWVDVIAELD